MCTHRAYEEGPQTNSTRLINEKQVICYKADGQGPRTNTEDAEMTSNAALLKWFHWLTRLRISSLFWIASLEKWLFLIVRKALTMLWQKIGKHSLQPHGAMHSMHSEENHAYTKNTQKDGKNKRRWKCCVVCPPGHNLRSKRLRYKYCYILSRCSRKMHVRKKSQRRQTLSFRYQSVVKKMERDRQVNKSARKRNAALKVRQASWANNP